MDHALKPCGARMIAIVHISVVARAERAPHEQRIDIDVISWSCQGTRDRDSSDAATKASAEAERHSEILNVRDLLSAQATTTGR